MPSEVGFTFYAMHILMCITSDFQIFSYLLDDANTIFALNWLDLVMALGEN